MHTGRRDFTSRKRLMSVFKHFFFLVGKPFFFLRNQSELEHRLRECLCRGVIVMPFSFETVNRSRWMSAGFLFNSIASVVAAIGLEMLVEDVLAAVDFVKCEQHRTADSEGRDTTMHPRSHGGGSTAPEPTAPHHVAAVEELHWGALLGGVGETLLVLPEHLCRNAREHLLTAVESIVVETPSMSSSVAPQPHTQASGAAVVLSRLLPNVRAADDLHTPHSSGSTFNETPITVASQPRSRGPSSSSMPSALPNVPPGGTAGETGEASPELMRLNDVSYSNGMLRAASTVSMSGLQPELESLVPLMPTTTEDFFAPCSALPSNTAVEFLGERSDMSHMHCIGLPTFVTPPRRTEAQLFADPVALSAAHSFIEADKSSTQSHGWTQLLSSAGSAKAPSSCNAVESAPHMIVFDLDKTLLRAKLSDVTVRALRDGEEKRKLFVDPEFLSKFCAAADTAGHLLGIASFSDVNGVETSSCVEVINLLDSVLPLQRQYLSNPLHVVCHTQLKEKGKAAHIDRLVTNFEHIASSKRQQHVAGQCNPLASSADAHVSARETAPTPLHSGVGWGFSSSEFRYELPVGLHRAADLGQDLRCSTPPQLERSGVQIKDVAFREMQRSASPLLLPDTSASPRDPQQRIETDEQDALLGSTQQYSASQTLVADRQCQQPAGRSVSSSRSVTFTSLSSSSPTLGVEHEAVGSMRCGRAMLLPRILIDDDPQNCRAREGLAGAFCCSDGGFTRDWYQKQHHLQQLLGISFDAVFAPAPSSSPTRNSASPSSPAAPQQRRETNTSAVGMATQHAAGAELSPAVRSVADGAPHAVAEPCTATWSRQTTLNVADIVSPCSGDNSSLLDAASPLTTPYTQSSSFVVPLQKNNPAAVLVVNRGAEGVAGTLEEEETRSPHEQQRHLGSSSFGGSSVTLSVLSPEPRSASTATPMTTPPRDAGGKHTTAVVEHEERVDEIARFEDLLRVREASTTQLMPESVSRTH